MAHPNGIRSQRLTKGNFTEKKKNSWFFVTTRLIYIYGMREKKEEGFAAACKWKFIVVDSRHLAFVWLYVEDGHKQTGWVWKEKLKCPYMLLWFIVIKSIWCMNAGRFHMIPLVNVSKYKIHMATLNSWKYFKDCC